MNKEDCTFAKASDFTKAEKFDIALKYLEYNAKLCVYRAFTETNDRPRMLASAAALTAMLQLLSNDDSLVHIATELQLAEDSPIWEIVLD